MDLTHAELILKHVLNKHEGATEAVNTLYEEIAKKMNAKEQNKAKKSMQKY